MQSSVNVRKINISGVTPRHWLNHLVAMRSVISSNKTFAHTNSGKKTLSSNTAITNQH